LYQEIRNDAGELVADAEVTSVLMDLQLRSSIGLPPVLAEQFTPAARVPQPDRLKE
jgi:acyl-CoA thioesterase FadM